eukprot:3274602-Rhodomonas_salina.1
MMPSADTGDAARAFLDAFTIGTNEVANAFANAPCLALASLHGPLSSLACCSPALTSRLNMPPYCLILMVKESTGYAWQGAKQGQVG